MIFFSVVGFIVQTLATVPLMFCIAAMLVVASSAGWFVTVWSLFLTAALALWYGAAWSFREAVHHTRDTVHGYVHMAMLWYYPIGVSFVGLWVVGPDLVPQISVFPNMSACCNSTMLLVGVVFLCDVGALTHINKQFGSA